MDQPVHLLLLRAAVQVLIHTVSTAEDSLPSGSFSGLAATTYLVTAKDGNGCQYPESLIFLGGTPPTVYNVTGGGSTCTGSGFPVGLSRSQAGVTYFLLLNNTIIGSMPPANILPGFAFSFGNQTVPGVYTVMASNANGLHSDNVR